jgi:hypothetical protein
MRIQKNVHKCTEVVHSAGFATCVLMRIFVPRGLHMISTTMVLRKRRFCMVQRTHCGRNCGEDSRLIHIVMPFLIPSQGKMVDRGIFNKNGAFPFSANEAGFLALTSSISKRFLPPNFQPGSWDVVCHNGKEPQEHGKSFESSGLPLFSTLITSNCIPLTVYYSWEQAFQNLH